MTAPEFESPLPELEPLSTTVNQSADRAGADAQLADAFESARAVGYAAGSRQMLALHDAEDRWTPHMRVSADGQEFRPDGTATAAV